MYQVGQPVTLRGRFTDSDGNLVDPDAVTITITPPTGSAVTQTAVKDTTGCYHYVYTPASVGLFQYLFTGTGANAGETTVDAFTASAATSSALVSLDQVKKQLNKKDPNDDVELLGYIQSATDTINTLCGYSAPTVFTETVEGRADASGRTTLILSRTPVLSVTSITNQLQGLPDYDLTELVINPQAGTLIWANWFAFYGPLTVTYTAGRTSVPPILQTACALMVKWLWETRRGGGTSTPDQGGDEIVTLGGLMMPARVAMLIRSSPYVAVPGIA